MRPRGFVLRRCDLNEFAVLEKKRPLILRGLLDPPLREGRKRKKVKVQLLSHVRLFAILWTVASHVRLFAMLWTVASSVHGIF